LEVKKADEHGSQKVQKPKRKIKKLELDSVDEKGKVEERVDG